MMIKASEDTRIYKLITLAGVSDFKSRFPTKQVLRIGRAQGVIL